MRKFFTALLIAACFTLPHMVMADNLVEDFVPSAQKIGSGQLKFALWPVYNATLYAPHGQWQPDQPFALKLSYLMTISGKDIARKSVQEMRRLGTQDEIKLAAWYEQMVAIFPNVRKGSSLTGIRTQDGATIFFSGNRKIGQIDDADFTPAFFGIWFSPRTRSPSLRAALLDLQ